MEHWVHALLLRFIVTAAHVVKNDYYEIPDLMIGLYLNNDFEMRVIRNNTKLLKSRLSVWIARQTTYNSWEMETNWASI